MHSCMCVCIYAHALRGGGGKQSGAGLGCCMRVAWGGACKWFAGWLRRCVPGLHLLLVAHLLSEFERLGGAAQMVLPQRCQGPGACRAIPHADDAAGAPLRPNVLCAPISCALACMCNPVRDLVCAQVTLRERVKGPSALPVQQQAGPGGTAGVSLLADPQRSRQLVSDVVMQHLQDVSRCVWWGCAVW